MGVKLKWRVTVVTCLGLSALVYITVISGLLSDKQLRQSKQPSHYDSANLDTVFRSPKKYESSHLGVQRQLVDKSNSYSSSNLSSPESLFPYLPSLTGRKVNNVPEEVRRKYLFKETPAVEIDESKDYFNMVFTKNRRDRALFTSDLNDLTPRQMIYHINKYRHKARRAGRKMDIFDPDAVKERDGTLKNWETWYLNLSQYELYRHDDTIIDKVLEDLATVPVVFSKQLSGGTQLKLKLSFANDMEGLWKPMRFTRETETLSNHYYFSDFERHHAEIAGFHLDRVMGFRRNPPVSGRILNITSDIKAYASPRFNKTIFYSPIGNMCFYGKCSYYCDSNHAICGHPDWVEGSVAVFLPPDDIAPRIHRKNPWRRSYSRSKKATWETNSTYCSFVRRSWSPFESGRSLLDLIDLTIFDFIQGNMDRHHYELFDFPDDWDNDTTPVILDNGRGWGKMYRDEVSILTPLIQCCQVRHSTVQKLMLYDTGPYKLAKLLDISMASDPLYPILASPHYEAVDRRVKIILKEIQRCVQNSAWSNVVLDDGF